MPFEAIFVFLEKHALYFRFSNRLAQLVELGISRFILSAGPDTLNAKGHQNHDKDDEQNNNNSALNDHFGFMASKLDSNRQRSDRR